MFKLILCFAPLLAWANPFKGNHQVHEKALSHEMVVAFEVSSLPTVINGKIHFENAKLELSSVESSFLSEHQFTALFPLDYSESMMRSMDYVDAPVTNKVNIIRLSGLMNVVVTDIPIDKLIAICEEFETIENVRYCSLSPILPSTQQKFSVGRYEPPVFVSPPTVDYSDKQVYFKDAPNGINAQYAWDLGILGDGIHFLDVEDRWNVDHVDLPEIALGTPDIAIYSSPDHGTAVAGVLVAQHNGFGVNGGAPNAKFTGYNVNSHQAIALAVQDASVGDVIILELHSLGCQTFTRGAPYDFASLSTWELVKEATDAGIVVVAAAGNAGEDLDGDCYQSYRDRGDNGGIIVGAGHPINLDRMNFSSYGSMVHLQGWGSNVTTTGGYGDDLGGGVNSNYTDKFNGTSSATPIVASAVALVQSWAKQNLNRYLAPREIRTLLINTGKPQGGTDHIGPLPDVKAAIESLMGINTSSSVSVSSSLNVSSSSDPTTAVHIEGIKKVIQINPNGLYSNVSGIAEVFSVKGDRVFSIDVEQGKFSSWPSSLAKGMWVVRLNVAGEITTETFSIQ